MPHTPFSHLSVLDIFLLVPSMNVRWGVLQALAVRVRIVQVIVLRPHEAADVRGLRGEPGAEAARIH